MKKLLSLLAVCLLSLSVSAETLKEGVHYEVIGEKATSTPEIKEFFSYYCPHCFTYEPLAKRLSAKADNGNFKFEKSHVDFLRAAGPDIQFMLTKALVAGDRLNKPEISDAIFQYIHKNRSVFTSEKDVRQIFIANGVSGEEFEKTFNSFGVKAQAKNMKKLQDEYASKRILTGVPTFVVNGKYKILSKGFNARTYGELFDQIESAALELVKKK
ncbi:thiol:disulfide interchange protein DsbA/DsbL [Psychrosphaera haliotis]|uniref:thiol:disulfide interchange protein DsbA/DsbL n=1 Tax=Psychrosphaera haliotis TaxID=555083 RepID=UPI00236FB83D|nr:thiol:disulfide interchange protein DsbA/DsbL [Psychrosphaera haliotis]